MTTPYGGQPGPASRPRVNRMPLLIGLLALVALALSVTAWAVTRSGDDPRAQAEKFVAAVQHNDFDGAKRLLCKSGQDTFSDLTALKRSLIGRGDIIGYRVGSVSDSIDLGSRRKHVTVELQLTGGARSVTLSLVKESGKYQVCGF